ncbi:hypothetical protein LPB73_07440 [Tardiphaga sp. 37S4]|uniref:hypothetical protein n=1 Tax=Tardiphaga sp. 37S4 TaxID=1404741 RepID=UPI001E5CB7D8|nr:hypothetical protein [Tardiphaga sp. 37S4]UFS77201.1 hypothetical protein LPB73_07440 [Tardiphaga sp. 37S4]
MTPEQLQKLMEALAKARIPEERNRADWPFPRGWNAGVEFAESQINKILKDAAA